MPVCPRFRTLILAVLLALFGASVASAQTQTVPESCDPDPVDEISSGHTALFDVYWDPETETLNNNPCPPTVVHHPGEDDGFGNVTPPTATRTPTAIDIGHTIIHVPESDKETVTADGNGPYDGIHYDFLRTQWTEDDDGNLTQSIADSASVWVLPGCDTTPAPTYCLGFSAGLLQPGDWNGDIQYEFESIREPGHAVQGRGEVYVFEVENNVPAMIWRTDNADTNELRLAPGTYDHGYWAFTAPGTYEFAVHVKGHPNANRTGGPLIEATTVTSEVRRYTFHVGLLVVNHDPVFEVKRSVSENATGGTDVGSPVVVKDLDATTLCFALTGHGAENFILEGTTGTAQCGTMTAVNRDDDGMIGAQIKVRERSYLDYETKASYDLRLQVTDGEDPESNPDPSIDDSIAVHIALIDGPDNVRGSSLTLHAPTSATVGESITLSASFGGGWPTTPGAVTFTWYRRPAGQPVTDWTGSSGSNTSISVTNDQTGIVEYSVQARWYDHSAGAETVASSSDVTVSWQ